MICISKNDLYNPKLYAYDFYIKYYMISRHKYALILTLPLISSREVFFSL